MTQVSLKATQSLHMPNRNGILLQSSIFRHIDANLGRCINVICCSQSTWAALCILGQNLYFIFMHLRPPHRAGYVQFWVFKQSLDTMSTCAAVLALCFLSKHVQRLQDGHAGSVVEQDSPCRCRTVWKFPKTWLEGEKFKSLIPEAGEEQYPSII